LWCVSADKEDSIILKRILKKQTCDWVVDWIHQTQNRDQRQAVMNTVNESSGSIKGGEFLD